MKLVTSLTQLLLILLDLYKDADAKDPIFNFECPIGSYGENCDNKCSEYCHVPRRCDGVTGQCGGGCQPGWFTKTCEQKCPSGTFGNNCRRECGHCLEKYHCHHINGSCLNGCSQGYRGEHCKHQCENGYYGKNCDHKCSKYCVISRRCDGVTGQCYGGCQLGWYTKTCEQKAASRGITLIPVVVFIQCAVFGIVFCVF